jgi:putative spermidine/putrescine transport system permease protein
VTNQVTNQVMSRPGRGRRAPELGVLAPVALVVAVVGAATVSLLLSSLGLTPYVGRAELTTGAYRAVSPDLGAALGQTLTIALSSALAAALVGLATASLLLALVRGRRLLLTLSAAVVAVPHLVGAVSVGLLLSQAGVVARLVGSSPADFPVLVGGHWPVATVLELAWKESAFVALVVVGALAGRHEELVSTAAVLGASPFQRWRRVVLPLALPSLSASTLIVLVYSIGVYEVPRLLNQAYPEPLALLSNRLFGSIDLTARPQAAAVALLTTALALTAAVLAALSRRGRPS